MPKIPILTPKHVAQKLQIFLIREKIRQIIEDTHYFNEMSTKFDDFFFEKFNFVEKITFWSKFNYWTKIEFCPSVFYVL